MSVVLYILAALLIVASFAVVGVVMLQDSKADGMAALGASNESYFGKNKANSKEAKLGRLTIILGIVFGVLIVVIDILVANGLVK